MPGNLIYYALVLIVVAIVAALLGFGGVASTAMSGAHLFIWVAVVLLIVGVVFALNAPSVVRRVTSARAWPESAAACAGAC